MSDQKVKMAITVDKKVADWIEQIRGLIPRSTLINVILKEKMKNSWKIESVTPLEQGWEIKWSGPVSGDK